MSKLSIFKGAYYNGKSVRNPFGVASGYVVFNEASRLTIKISLEDL